MAKQPLSKNLVNREARYPHIKAMNARMAALKHTVVIHEKEIKTLKEDRLQIASLWSAVRRLQGL